MKKLYITSIATAAILLLFLAVMSLVRSPLGGEPYTVTPLTDKKQAQKNLQTKLAQLAEAKKNSGKKKNPVQSEPLYFSEDQNPSQISDNSVTLSGEGTALKTDTNAKIAKAAHLDPNTIPKANNELADFHGNSLVAAPIKELIENTKYGLLPRISLDGKRPLDMYARPAKLPKTNRPQKTIAILITELGLSQPTTENALEKLPPEVTLAFNPYSTGLRNWMRRSRQLGHEIMLQLPMEPYDYPDNDPGPHTMIINQSDKVNLERLKWIMARMTGYVAMVNLNGSKFTSDEDALHPILQELKNRGLAYMDIHPQASEIPYQLSQEFKLDYLQGSILLDKELSSNSIDKALGKLEEMANKHGNAIGIASSYPISIQRIAQWSETLKKRGITLVPVSATISEKQS